MIMEYNSVQKCVQKLYFCTAIRTEKHHFVQLTYRKQTFCTAHVQKNTILYSLQYRNKKKRPHFFFVKTSALPRFSPARGTRLYALRVTTGSNLRINMLTFPSWLFCTRQRSCPSIRKEKCKEQDSIYIAPGSVKTAHLSEKKNCHAWQVK